MRQLSKTVPPKTLPRLPKRGLFTTNTRAPKFVDKRRHKLERYLQDVLCHPQCENSVELLSWLGGVSTMRNDAEESKRALRRWLGPVSRLCRRLVDSRWLDALHPVPPPSHRPRRYPPVQGP